MMKNEMVDCDVAERVLDYILEAVPKTRVLNYTDIPLGLISGIGPTKVQALEDFYYYLDQVLQGRDRGVVLRGLNLSCSKTDPVRYRYTLTAGFDFNSVNV